jgi:hypothetical protein
VLYPVEKIIFGEDMETSEYESYGSNSLIRTTSTVKTTYSTTPGTVSTINYNYSNKKATLTTVGTIKISQQQSPK